MLLSNNIEISSRWSCKRNAIFIFEDSCMTSILIYLSIREISERQKCLRYKLYPTKKFGNSLCFNRPKSKNLHILQNYLCISETFSKINFYTHFLLLFNSSKTEFFSCIIVNLQKTKQKQFKILTGLYTYYGNIKKKWTQTMLTFHTIIQSPYGNVLYHWKLNYFRFITITRTIWTLICNF